MKIRHSTFASFAAMRRSVMTASCQRSIAEPAPTVTPEADGTWSCRNGYGEVAKQGGCNDHLFNPSMRHHPDALKSKAGIRKGVDFAFRDAVKK